MSEAKPLLFIHIPKTGGMAIKSILKDSLFDLDFKNRHLFAREFCDRISRQLYDKLYKFTVVRNPYDRLVSYYYFMLNDVDHTDHIVHTQTLSEYIAWACDDNVSTQFEQISLNGRIAVDRILYFETLQEDWERLAVEFNLPTVLPALNTSAHMHWCNELSIGDMESIYDSFLVDFKMFGYDTV